MKQQDDKTGSGTGNRRAVRRSKEDLLDLAIELADEPAPAAQVRHYAVSHVSLSAVANAAGVTRGALYRLWPTQHEFWNDLVEVILAERHDGFRDGTAGDGRDLRDRRHLKPHATSTTATSLGPPWVEIDGRTDRLVDAAQDLLLLDRAHLLRAGVAGYPGASSSEHGRLFGWGRSSASVDQLTGQIEHGLAAGGLDCLDGLTPTHVATATVAIANGFPIIGRLADRWELNVHDPSFGAGAGAPGSLLGVTVAAINTELTLPKWETTPHSPLRVATNGHAERRPPSSEPYDDEPPRPTRRLSGRRRDYLDLAATLAVDGAVADDGLSRAVGYVTLDGLARAAKVTRQTLTNLWPDQAAFRLDLFSRLLTRERRWVTAAIADATAKATVDVDHQGPRATWLQIVRGIGDRLHAALDDHLDRISFLAYAPVLASRDVADTLRRAHDELVDETARQLALLLRAIGRRPRQGVAWRQLALALFTLVDGMNQLLRSSPDLVRDDIVRDHHQEHTLTGLAAGAILTHMTEASDAGFSTEDFVDLVS